MEYFTDDDFEIMFKSLDFFKTGEISQKYLFLALDLISCDYQPSNIIEKHKLQENEMLNMKRFVRIIRKEYKTMSTLGGE